MNRADALTILGMTRMEAKMVTFTATIEILVGQSAAIVALFDHSGEWSGAGRIECRSGRSADLYELGYARASQMAAVHGGRLGRYSKHSS